MRDLVCRHCDATVQVPDDVKQAHCVRCGQALDPPETHVTASAPFPAPSQAIQPEPFVDRPPIDPNAPMERPERYATWEEFRTTSPVVQRTWTQLAMRALPDMRGFDCRPLPADMPASADGLGKPIASLKIPGDYRLLIHFISLVVVGTCFFVACLPLDLDPAQRPARPWTIYEKVLFAALWVGGGLAFGYWLSFWRDPNYPVTYWILEEGIVWQRAGNVDACPWAELDEVEISHDTAAVRVWLRLRPNFKACITAFGKPALMPLLEFIITKTAAAQFIPQLRRVCCGDEVQFGVVRLDRSSFTSPFFFARWSKIRKVVADRQVILVDCKDQASWQTIRYQDVSLPPLVLALSHVMIEEHSRLPQVDA